MKEEDFEYNKENLKRIYREYRSDIKERLKEFKEIGEKGTREDIFRELVFCLLTPQSKARMCWRAVERLTEGKLMVKGRKKQIQNVMHGVRFKYKKSEYIVKAREKFFGDDILYKRIKESPDYFDLREFIVKEIKGLGWKESSHFLRNIGKGENLAILDRHILRNLAGLKIIESIPSNLSERKYKNIEKRMKNFSENIGINMEELDLVLWAKETGEVFK